MGQVEQNPDVSLLGNLSRHGCRISKLEVSAWFGDATDVQLRKDITEEAGKNVVKKTLGKSSKNLLVCPFCLFCHPKTS